jgi:hypothetical protein
MKIVIPNTLQGNSVIAEYPFDTAIEFPEQAVLRGGEARTEALFVLFVLPLQWVGQQQVMPAQSAVTVCDGPLTDCFDVGFRHWEKALTGQEVQGLKQRRVQRQQVVIHSRCQRRKE